MAHSIGRRVRSATNIIIAWMIPIPLIALMLLLILGLVVSIGAMFKSIAMRGNKQYHVRHYYLDGSGAFDEYANCTNLLVGQGYVSFDTASGAEMDLVGGAIVVREAAEDDSN